MKNSKRFHLGILPHVAMFLAMLLTPLVQAQELRTYFVADPQGSPVIGTDAYANVVWSEDYLPYGERRYRSVSSGDNERWFTAAVQNEDTGLVDLGNRKYDPVLGRFLSIDPVGASAEKPFSVNRYAYANNNPYRYVDPQGDVPVDTIWDIGNVVYDLGKVTVGWTIGNQALVVEGLADAAIDTAAMLIPYVPAGSTKVARLAAKEAKATANAARAVPKIKPGSANGPTAAQRFPESVRDAAKAENLSATCVFCQRPGTGSQVDHAIPRARGGNATLDNAQLACPHCNASKGAGDFPKTPPPGYTGPWPPQ